MQSNNVTLKRREKSKSDDDDFKFCLYKVKSPIFEKHDSPKSCCHRNVKSREQRICETLLLPDKFYKTSCTLGAL